MCLEAIKQYGCAIQYIKNSTEEMKLEAVKGNGYAIQYIKNPTEKVCLEAIKQNGRAIKFIEDPTEELCLEAVKQNENVIEYIDKKKLLKIIKKPIILNKEVEEYRKKIKQINTENIDPYFLCPISYELMVDCHILNCGHSFSKKSIDLIENGKCPICKKHINSVSPNWNMISHIKETILKY